MAGDFVNVSGSTENTQVHFSGSQKWYYLAGQSHDELLIFKNADSEAAKGAPFGNKSPNSSIYLS